MCARPSRRNVRAIQLASPAQFCVHFFFFKHIFILPISPVERVRNQWDNTQHGVVARLQQLDNMIGHSDQWESQRREMQALIGHKEGWFHNMLQQSRESRDPLTIQLADSKVIVD